MMSVGLHMRLIGHPARAMGLQRLLDHIAQARRLGDTAGRHRTALDRDAPLPRQGSERVALARPSISATRSTASGIGSMTGTPTLPRSAIADRPSGPPPMTMASAPSSATARLARANKPLSSLVVPPSTRSDRPLSPAPDEVRSNPHLLGTPSHTSHQGGPCAYDGEKHVHSRPPRACRPQRSRPRAGGANGPVRRRRGRQRRAPQSRHLRAAQAPARERARHLRPRRVPHRK